MSTNQKPDPSSKRQQLRAAQEKAAKQEKTRRITLISVVAVIVLAIVGGVTWAVISMNQSKQIQASDVHALVLGKADAPVTVDIYQDFICPYCGEFERANSADISALVDSGQMRLRLHPMNFLDEASLGSKYSSRAANALITVYKAEPDKTLAFNAALFANQPAENTTGLTDDQIAQIATQAGVSAEVVATFTDMANVDFATQSSAEASKDGVTGTPTILIDGKKFSGNILTEGPFRQAVEAAAKGV